MADSANQGLKTAIIVLSILLVIVAGLAGYFGSNSSAYYQSFQAEAGARKNADSVATRLTKEITELVAIIGHVEPNVGNAQTDAAGAPTVMGRAKVNLQQQGSGQPSPDYKGAVFFLRSEIERLMKSAAELALQKRGVEDALEKHRSIAQAEIAVATQERDAARADALKWNSELGAMNAEQKAQIAQLTDRMNDAINRAEQLAANIELLQREWTTRETRMLATIEGLRDRADALENVNLDTPDGKVRTIERSTRTLYVNIGKADLLQPQTTFSVFPREAHHLADVKPKGKIEIIAVLPGEEHLAEARVIKEELNQPIVPGDLIYNPGWNPGQPQRFALAGVYDVDGDKRSDRDFIKEIIRQVGGVVVAEVMEGTGEIKGEIDHQTDWFLLGDPPQISDTVIDDPTKKPALEFENYNKFLKDGRTYTRTHQFRKFLDLMGYSPNRRLYTPGSEYNLKLGVTHNSGTYDLKAYERYAPSRVSPIYLPNYNRSFHPRSSGTVSGVYQKGQSVKATSAGTTSQSAKQGRFIQEGQPATPPQKPAEQPAAAQPPSR